MLGLWVLVMSTENVPCLLVGPYQMTLLPSGSEPRTVLVTDTRSYPLDIPFGVHWLSRLLLSIPMIPIVDSTTTLESVEAEDERCGILELLQREPKGLL